GPDGSRACTRGGSAVRRPRHPRRCFRPRGTVTARRPRNDQRKTSGQEMKATIITEAAALFSERGYGRTKVVDIARAVGITPPSLYWHFASKEEILFEYLHSGLVEFNQRMQQAVDAHDSPTDRLRAVAVAHTRAQLEFRDQAKAVLSVTHSATQLSAGLSAERLEQIRTLIREHI